MSDPRETLQITPGKDGAPDDVGHSPDGRQFIARVIRGDDGRHAVIHWFAAEGDYLESDHDGPFGDGEKAAEALDAMVTRLAPVQIKTVTVKAFEDEIAGTRVGLVAGNREGEARFLPD